MIRDPNVLIVTTDAIPEKRCTPIAPIVASCCLSKSLFGDMAANVKNWTVGGELPVYSEMLDKAGALILERMAQKASEYNAEAIVGFRLVTSNVAEGAAELIGYGTAVRIEGEEAAEGHMQEAADEGTRCRQKCGN